MTLERLVTRLRKILPNIRIIVVDDTPKSFSQVLKIISLASFPVGRLHPQSAQPIPPQFEIDLREELNLKGVEQILLTADTGWFAGRAVALALVETEYFYWLDDDFDIQDSNVFAQDQDSKTHELFSTYGRLRGFGVNNPDISYLK